MDCEVLFPDKVSWRARLILEAMIEVMPGCRVSAAYTGRAPLLMSWGLGHPVRRQWTDAHLANGGRVIGWDLGYWDRDRAMRVTVDHNHPWRVMRDMPGDRWHGTLREDANPDGPVLLVGMGVKSRSQFGWSGLEWEAAMLERIRATGRAVVYRPKKGRQEGFPGVRNIDGPIENALKGCSLVVCRHSNVAVDACIAGVPVVCEDGAARALYGSDLSAPVIPGPAARRQFLHNLGYWQWLPTEAAQAWSFLQTVLGSTSAAAPAR